MSRNYIATDYELMIDICKSEINFLKSSWQNMLGRPLVTIACRDIHLGISESFLKWLSICVCFGKIVFGLTILGRFFSVVYCWGFPYNF